MNKKASSDATDPSGDDGQGGASASPRLQRPALFTPREIALMRWVAAGCTNAQIGLNAHRSEKTVRNQLTRLYAKLGARNRAEAVAIYMRGWVADSSGQG